MEDELLDNGILGAKHKFNYPIYLLVIAFLNVVLTFVAYSEIYPKINRTESMAVIESEGSLAFIQASFWVLLMLFVDIVQAFKKAIKEQTLFKWGLNLFVWLLGSLVVILFITILILISRVVFIVIVLMITSASQVNFERIVLITPYLLFTIVFIVGILLFNNRTEQTES